MDTFGPRTLTKLTWFVAFACWLAIAVGLTGLAGSIFHLLLMRTIVPGLVAIKANTAICFILLGISLWVQRKEDQATGIRKQLAQGLTAIVATVGLLSFAEFLFGWDLGIDQLLFGENPQEAVGSVRPGLMSPITAVVLILLGTAVALLDWTTKRKAWPSQLLCLAAGFVSAATLIDFVLKPHHFHTHIALPTVVTLCIFSFAPVLARPKRLWAHFFSRDMLAGNNSTLAPPLQETWIRHWVFRYAVAVLMVAVAAVARRLTGTGIPQPLVYITFYPAIMLPALLGGMWPGILATLLSALCVDYYFFTPAGHFDAKSATDLIGLTLFALEGIGISAIVGFLQRKRKRAADDLLQQRKLLQAEMEASTRAKKEWELTFDTVSDPVMLLDVEQRILRANLATTELLGLEPGEVLGRHCYELIHRTQGPPPSCPVQRMLRSGVEERADVEEPRLGKTFDVVATPLRNGNAKLHGCVHVIRDVTERKRAEEQARLSHERLALAQRVAHLGSWTMDVRTGEVTWSDELFRMCGMELSSEAPPYPKQSSLFAPESWARLRTALENTVSTGVPYELELETVRADGKRGWMLARGEAVRNAEGSITCLQGVALDITQRKSAEEELQAHERLYRTLLNSLPQQIFVKDRDSRYVACNEAFATLLGIRPEQFAGKTDFDFFSRELAEKYRTDDRRVMENGTAEEIEEQYVREGQKLWVQTVKTPVRDANGEVTGILGIFWDVTEKKQGELSLHRVNRTLQALSECTDALMRAPDEKTMLQRVCDAAVGAGAYRMAWVGYAEQDANKTVRPAAWAGMEQGYLESASISWADVERGRGPTGTAIRTGRVAICRDTMTDPNFAPWRKEALGRGYRSSIVLPLRSERAIFGALMIYATEPQAFDVREQRLLEELANNVSYAIATRRARAEREKTQEELKAERQRFRDVLDRLPAYVVLLTPDYHVPFANKFFIERFGESQGKRCYEYLFGRNQPCEICETYKVLKTGSPQRWKWTGPDGRHYDIHDFSFTDTDGSTLILEMGIDITEREEAEAELRKASRYTRSLIEASVDPLVTISREGKITDVNEASERVTGVARDKLIGSDFCEYFTDPEEARRGYQEVFSAGFVHDYPLAIRHVSGSITDVLYNATVFRNEKGEAEGVFAAARDVTARRRAEEALVDSETRYRSLVVATTQVVWTTNAAGEVVADMPSWRQFTGQTEAEIQGWGWINSLHPEDREQTAKVWSTAVANHTLYDTEYRMLRADGEYRHVAVRGVPVVDKNGAIREWIGTCTDITERKRSEEEVRKLNDELEERVKQRTAQLEAANKELEAFSYSVSHDLRAPLRHISGFSKILSEEFGPSLPEEAQHHLERIQQGTSRMGALVDDLLNLARVGRQEIRLQVTGLKSLVDEVIVGIKPEYGDRQVEWKIGALPFIECDPGLMKQVLQNLLSNALKFTRPRPVAVIEVGQVEQQGGPAIFVRDNGVGFSMKYADKLFGVFQRLHRAEDFEGTGVGLATVQRILYKHGWRIWAESELDKGTTFYFTLAVAHSEASRAMATGVGGNS